VEFFQNIGVTSLTAALGLLVDRSSGDIVISNTGILSATAGQGISIVNTSGSIIIENTGITSIVPGTGILLSRTGGEVIVTNTLPNVSQNVFRTISVTGQADLTPNTSSSVLTLTAGSGISVVSNASINSLSINNTGILQIDSELGINVVTTNGLTIISLNPTLTNNLQGDVIGSVFADSSSLLVDGVNGLIVGDVNNNTTSTSIIVGNTSTLLITSSDSDTSIQLANDAALTLNSVSGISISTNVSSSDVLIGNGTNSLTITPGSRFNTNIDDIRILGGVQGQVLATDGQGNHVWTSSSGSGSSFVFKIAGDDSTQIIINNGETVKIFGTNGISTATDTEGAVTISGESISSMQSRQTTLGTTPSITQGSVENLVIPGFKSYLLQSLQTSSAARVRIYTSVAARSADSARIQSDPIPINAGVIADIETLNNTTVLITPVIIGFNSESTPVEDIVLAITNNSGSTQQITITLSVLQLET
jgi:hypothetical protein